MKSRSGPVSHMAPSQLSTPTGASQIDIARRRNLPLGVKDHLWREARLRHTIEAKVMASFQTWGYHPVILPMFEFADTLQVQTSAGGNARLYRFLDREGRTLVLRPDMTSSVARLVGTRLSVSDEGPYRFCYAGSVFRHEASSGLQYQQEFRQLGVELIGADTPEADTETLACLCASLHASGLENFWIVVGHSGYYNGLIDALKPEPFLESLLRTALRRKSEFALHQVLDQSRLTGKPRQSIENLLRLSGMDTRQVLERAADSCLNVRMEQALENLRRIVNGLQAYGELDHVMIDLAEIRDLDYYTGMTFEILLPDSSMLGGRGGRYDNLMGHFGPAAAAVGGVLQLDRLVQAQSSATTSSVKPVPLTVLVGFTRDAHCLQAVQRLRRTGIDVVIDPLPRTSPQLVRHGETLQARCTLLWTESRQLFRVLSSSIEGLAAETRPEDLLAILAQGM